MTKIEWVARPGTTPESWNPITGCSKLSEGCRNCYAERMALRLAGRFGYPEAPHHFDVTGHTDKLAVPFGWRTPRTVFVCSMGDLFHERIPWSDLQRIFDVMVYEKNRKHTFLLLTKRADRMQEFISSRLPELPRHCQHIWVGVSVENQQAADERIPTLLRTPAAVRFVSCEPLLGEVDLQEWLYEWRPVAWGPGPDDWACDAFENGGIHWVIASCESGPSRRPVHADAFRSLRDQCQDAGVPFFLKQIAMDNHPCRPKVVKLPELDGKVWQEWPSSPGKGRCGEGGPTRVAWQLDILGDKEKETDGQRKEKEKVEGGPPV